MGAGIGMMVYGEQGRGLQILGCFVIMGFLLFLVLAGMVALERSRALQKAVSENNDQKQTVEKDFPSPQNNSLEIQPSPIASVPQSPSPNNKGLAVVGIIVLIAGFIFFRWASDLNQDHERGGAIGLRVAGAVFIIFAISIFLNAFFPKFERSRFNQAFIKIFGGIFVLSFFGFSIFYYAQQFKSATPSWPPMAMEIDWGESPIRIVNPNNFDVTVGVRSVIETSDGIPTAMKGKDFSVPANSENGISVRQGQYDIYFKYSSDPNGIYKGERISLSQVGTGVELKIVKAVNGNYEIKKVN